MCVCDYMWWSWSVSDPNQPFLIRLGVAGDLAVVCGGGPHVAMLCDCPPNLVALTIHQCCIGREACVMMWVEVAWVPIYMPLM